MNSVQLSGREVGEERAENVQYRLICKCKAFFPLYLHGNDPFN